MTSQPKASPLCECGHAKTSHFGFNYDQQCRVSRVDRDALGGVVISCTCAEYREAVSGETAAPAKDPLWNAASKSAAAPATPTTAELIELRTKAAKYDAINTPELYDFITATVNEALHQREKWGVEADGGKADADWFWLIGYLAGKALHNPPKEGMGDVDARLHRIITVAAAACNWHGATLGTYALMRPGIEAPNV